MAKQGLSQSNVFVINSMAGETVQLAVGTTSASVLFVSPFSISNYDVVVQNASTTKTIFVAFGASANGTVTAQVPGTGSPAAATFNAIPILPGAIYTWQKNSDAVKADTCAAISTGTGSSTVYFTSIQGS